MSGRGAWAGAWAVVLALLGCQGEPPVEPPPSGDPPAVTCTPATCAGQGKNCGELSDGCGGVLSCGECPPGQTCGGAGTPNVCARAFGGPGPWPIENITYGARDGILERPIVGTTTDEAQNLWVATHQALYLLQPGWTRFRRFTAEDGLHLQSNPVLYCDGNFAGGDRACPIPGAAADPGITEIAGGAPGEVFVGYAGIDEGSADWSDPNRHSGKLDRVKLRDDGTLQVDRFDLSSTAQGARFWHNRTVMRLLYDHFIHPHELYVGSNHGVVRLLPDLFPQSPPPGGLYDWQNVRWMADHLHPTVCFHQPCGSPGASQRMGGWRGLALAPDGQLWVAGRWTAGRIRWTPELTDWTARKGFDAFSAAFGDPYPLPPNENGFINEPVFRPPQEGDPVSLTAVGVAPDGRVWFSSAKLGSKDVAYGVASWDGYRFQPYDPVTELGMSERDVRDLVVLPDGRLVLAGPTTGLVFWNPATGEHSSLRAGQGLADDRVRRLELDLMVSPPALHVSTETGASVLRKLP